MSDLAERRARIAEICAAPEHAAYASTLRLMLNGTAGELTSDVVAEKAKMAASFGWTRVAAAVERLRRSGR